MLKDKKGEKKKSECEMQKLKLFDQGLVSSASLMETQENIARKVVEPLVRTPASQVSDSQCQHQVPFLLGRRGLPGVRICRKVVPVPDPSPL